MVRALVFDRDHGVCAKCGADAAKAERILVKLERARQRAGTREQWASAEDAKQLLRGLFNRSRYDTRSFWEADHEVPLADGGRGVLDRLRDPLLGYRTLCVPCHVEVTRDAASARAAERRKKRAQEAASRSVKNAPDGAEITS